MDSFFCGAKILIITIIFPRGARGLKTNSAAKIADFDIHFDPVGTLNYHLATFTTMGFYGCYSDL